MTEQEISTLKMRYGIIGSSPILAHDIEVAVQVARTDLSVLITGENGVGKDIFSRIIHEHSTRKHGPCLSVNCGAFPSGTINSELFGHVKGAFTDARTDRKGYFEEANNGTLFLDEVGELPKDTQAMLLRILETGEYLRMGESTIHKTNVRVVAATNVDLPKAIKEGKCREDLYYRLCGIEIHIPSLRERKDDIPLLFRKFVADFSEKNTIPRITLTEEAKHLLRNYYWGGNVRQLKNIAEQLCVISEEREITAEMLRPYLKENELNRAPVLVSGGTNQQDSNLNEMLYKVIDIMRHDIQELQAQVRLLQSGQPISLDVIQVTPAVAGAMPMSTETPDQGDTQPQPSISRFRKEDDEIEEIEAEEYREEIKEMSEVPSWEQMEKETIRRALLRNRGSRKRTAAELKISERTLYRKIDKYGLNDI